MYSKKIKRLTQQIMKSYLKIGLIVLLPALVEAQDLKVSGKTVDQNGEPLTYCQYNLYPANIGGVSDAEGNFVIEGLESGSYNLSFHALGYRKKSIELELAGGNKELGEIVLQEDLLNLDEVVVSGTMRETYLAESPVTVEVVSSHFLENYSMPVNIMESIQLINGVQEVVACGVCFTNSISINGLPGPYTAVLMDGAPIYGSLASTYGLNGIPRQLIDRFEVIKGPNSTLYGSEAMAGVINIITKDPEDQPRLSIDLMGTTHSEAFGNIAFTTHSKRASLMSGINFAYINGFEDFNNDYFGDNINLDRLSGFSKFSLNRKSGKKLELMAKYYYEDRRNGVEGYLVDRAYREIRGSDKIYGESIYTNRIELFGTYELPVPTNWKLNFSLSSHEQDSYYGADHYLAEQRIGFFNLLRTMSKDKHQLLAGFTNRMEYYNDNTVATQGVVDGDTIDRPQEQWIPGVFLQDEWQVHRKMSLLGGLRLDYYNLHGPIFSPRLNLKYNLADFTIIRTNFGTGFKVVNLFTEDHAFVTGQREVIIEEELNPEKTWNLSVDISHSMQIGEGQAKIGVNGFFTHFTNKIIPDYDNAGQIIYSNSDGSADTRGVGLNFSHSIRSHARYNLSFNRQFVTQSQLVNGKRETEPLVYAADWTGTANANYDLKRWNMTIAYTAQITGPMQLPEVYDLDENGNPKSEPRAQRSEPFASQNIQLAKKWKKPGLRIYLGMQNLFNYRQQISPLSGYNDPNSLPGFSEYFDTAYAYSPIHGREFYLGFTWNIE